MLRDLKPDRAIPDSPPTDPEGVTNAFLAAMEDSDLESAIELLAEDVVYANVGLPTIRGREQVRSALGALSGPRLGFEVFIHSSAVDGNVVLNERTDAITFDRLRLQFWVMGHFEVEDGKITLWRDYFDLWDMTKATLRALAALAMPAMRPAPPAPGDNPGR